MIALRLFGWISRHVDRANPMLVRRVRQELRNKAFIGAYLLMLLIAVIAAAIASAASGRDSGRGLFAAVASTWSALMCIQALATTRAIAGDRGAASWDLIELTGLPPIRIIAGVVQSSLILGLLGAAGLAPFLVMSYLLRGLDLPTVVFALISLPMAGALLGAISATAACVGNNRQARQGLGLLVAIGLLVAWGMLTALWTTSERELSRWLADVVRGNVDALLGLAALVNGWIAAMAVALVLGSTLLTHRALDRSSPLRLVWCLVWLNAVLWFAGIIIYEGTTTGWRHLDEALTICSTMSVLWTLALALFAITEDIDITPRQQQAITSGRALRRLAMQFFGPGSGRGARCTLLLLLLSLIIAGPELGSSPALPIACYGLIVLMVGDILARGPLQRICQTATARRICTVAVFCVLSIVPPLLALTVDNHSAERLTMAFSPIAGLVQFDRKEWWDGIESYIISGLGLVGLGWLLMRCMRSGSGQARVTAREDDANPRG